MEHVLEDGCPFVTFSVSTYSSFIDVIFDNFTTIRPEELDWINTHLVGGRWWLTAEDNFVKLIIRFDEPSDD